MVLLGAGILALSAIVAVLAAVGYVVSIAESAPSIGSLKPISDGSTSVVYAADGQRLGFIQSDDLRTPITSKQIPQVLKDATVAIEDQRFYKHSGVDYWGVIRAAVSNLVSGKTVQGGSTITMQLVRNLYISRERTFKRKIREAKLAEELERKHDKDWILTKYLNSIPYGTVGGQSAIGVSAAARLFFDKPVGKLDLAQAALLAGLPQAPSLYNPFRDPDKAKRRRDEVLRKMAELRYVSQAEAAAAIAKPLEVKPNRYFTERRENYFFDFVKDELVKKYGANTVRQGGLRVYTTIDLRLQQAARQAIANRLNQPGDPSSAIVAIDPSNGYIRAMASSGDYDKSKFNLAAQGRRQPGSTFKVMVLMAALRKGMNPFSTYYVSKQLEPGWLPSAPSYGVSTYDHTYKGTINIEQALLRSDNSVFAQLDADVGPEEVRQTAYDMGIKTKLDAYPAEGLGGLTIGVSPLEMASAYATIAAEGVRRDPIAITKVVFPDRKVDDLGKPEGKQVFSDGVAYEAIKLLRANVTSGTGTNAAISCPAAGKTGTTSDFKDAWFAGFTPKLSTAVWVGYPSAGIQMTNVHGMSVSGSTFPSFIWHDFMQVAVGGDCADFPQPSTPFESQPWFGKYATTGTEKDRNYDKTDTTGGADGTGGTPADGADGNGKGNGGNPYKDPNLYEKPPQPPPRVEPPRGGGPGNGRGNGQGNGPDSQTGGNAPPPGGF